MKRIVFFCLLVVAGLAAACVEEKPVALGNPNPTGHTLQAANPAKLKMFFGRYAGTYVVVDVECANVLHTSPVDGYQAILARHEYGNLYVLVREGLYQEAVSQLKPNQKMRVFGIVSSAQAAADKEGKIAIIVDE